MTLDGAPLYRRRDYRMLGQVCINVRLLTSIVRFAQYQVNGVLADFLPVLEECHWHGLFDPMLALQTILVR